ncbi:hypothetical protein containing PEGA domain [Thermococcus cleftensis]|uniref:PEGA domain-containing protein n=2 Tax=Thermococcus cleftensis (strain DSM 27260 / KACC 17922 / CL1) TaxID=163003 RepID=I3ZW31_THECF|nr:hypothetical protein containing PEGA domain [Thermococcus cleftensis]
MRKGALVLLILLLPLFLPRAFSETTMEEWYKVGDSLIVRNTYTGENLYRIKIYDVDLLNEKVIFEFQALPDGSPVMYTVLLNERLYGDLSHGFDVEPLDVFMGISGDVSVRLRFYLDDGYTVVSDTATLRVSSDPSDAAVYIDGEYRGKTPLTVRLPSGRHDVVIMKEGYRPYNTTVVLETGEYRTIYASLDKIVGKLRVESTPSNAKVYLDGDYIGRTPLTQELSPGTYRIKLLLDGYFEYSTTVTVRDNETKVISAALKPKPGTLGVTSEPAGAKVYVNGTYIGTTPVQGYSLSPGIYRVKVTMTDYQAYEKVITVEPGQEYRISARLTPSWGVLKVNSNPSGAEVYINGDAAGKTPLELKLDPGTYTVRLSIEGYEDYEDSIEVRAGETAEVSANLDPIGYLTVLSEPSGAEVYLGDTYIGNTPLTGYKVRAGTYWVTIKKEGYDVYKTLVEVGAGETKEIKGELTPRETAEETAEAGEGSEATVSPSYQSIAGESPLGPYTIGAAVLILGVAVAVKFRRKPNEVKLLEKEFRSIDPSKLPEEARTIYDEVSSSLKALKSSKGKDRERAVRDFRTKFEELRRVMEEYRKLKGNIEREVRKMLSQGVPGREVE